MEKIKTRRMWVHETTGDFLTHEISAHEGFAVFEQDEKFRNFVVAGNFIHCENRFVINHPKYVRKNQDGIMFLTDYAKANEKECCIVFALKPVNIDKTGEEND